MSKGLKLSGLCRNGVSPTDLEIAAGDIVSVMGPSGAGKSLLMRAIADLDPHEGEASLKGQNCMAMPAPDWRRKVAYLPAESGWWADSVGEHFRDPGAALPRLSMLGFPEDVLTWDVARLSTGEKQRLALVRALESRPEVLLLDEPTAALDDTSEQAVETLLRELASKGVAILLVTHDAAQARRLAARRYRMESGRLWEEQA